MITAVKHKFWIETKESNKQYYSTIYRRIFKVNTA